MKIKYLLFVSLLIVLCSSCVKDDPKETPTPRTILYYVVESDLGWAIQPNIDAIVLAATKQNLNGGNLIVLYSESRPSNHTELLEIKVSPEGTTTRHHLRDYENVSAISPQFMREVIENVVSLYPAESYGMIFSSHGTSWMPANFSSMLRSFGEENSKYMEIYDLAKAIPDNLFEFIAFDACSMASIECVYELRNKADRILASPSETLAEGFPYKTVLPYFFTTTQANLGNVAEGFYQYYNRGGDYFGNISVTHTKYLEELAIITREILSSAGEEDLYSLPYDELQTLSFFRGSPTKLFDFDDVIKRLATEEQYGRFRNCLNKTLTNTYHTDRLWCGKGGYFNVKTFSGLSFYPLQEHLTELNSWYKNNLDWAKAIYK